MWKLSQIGMSQTPFTFPYHLQECKCTSLEKKKKQDEIGENIPDFQFKVLNKHLHTIKLVIISARMELEHWV